MKSVSKAIVLAAALLVAPAAVGCATRTVTTETSRYDEPRARYEEPPVEQHTRTEVVVENPEHEAHGVLGIVADIITLPFRAVEALFRAVF